MYRLVRHAAHGAAHHKRLQQRAIQRKTAGHGDADQVDTMIMRLPVRFGATRKHSPQAEHSNKQQSASCLPLDWNISTVAGNMPAAVSLRLYASCHLGGKPLRA